MYIREAILLFISIPFAIVLNYYVTSELLRYVGLFPVSVYVIILISQILIIYEIFKFFFCKWSKVDKIIITVIYFFILSLVMLARINLGSRIFQWNPFAFITDYYDNKNGEFLIPLFNVIMFIPMVTILSFFINKKKLVFFIGISIGIIFEVLQVMTMRGIFDLSDIILYLIGIMIGFYLYKYINKKI